MNADRDRVGALLAAATDFLVAVRAPRRHHIVCGLALDTGEIVLGLNIVSGLGPASVCAEQIALGEALKRPAASIDLAVSLRATFAPGDPAEIVPPCGRCRELLLEYAAPAGIVLAADPPGDDRAILVAAVTELLPHPFMRRVRPVTAGVDGYPAAAVG